MPFASGVEACFHHFLSLSFTANSPARCNDSNSHNVHSHLNTSRCQLTNSMTNTGTPASAMLKQDGSWSLPSSMNQFLFCSLAQVTRPHDILESNSLWSMFFWNGFGNQCVEQLLNLTLADCQQQPLWFKWDASLLRWGFSVPAQPASLIRKISAIVQIKEVWAESGQSTALML